MSVVSKERANAKPFELLLNQQQISRRIAQLGKEISHDYAHSTPVVVGVLKGCVVFLADLIRHIKLPMELEFVSAASYRHGKTQEKEIRLSSELPISIKGRDVLIVEGVVDSGRTVAAILKEFKKMEPASMEIVTLIDKPGSHRKKLSIKYKGFTVGNEFLIGYGLDNTQKYRNLPFIGKMIDD